jgi:hypothetical protein
MKEVAIIYRLFLLFLLSLSPALHASDDAAIAAQIIDKALTSLYNGNNVKAWGDTPAQCEIISHSRKMVAVTTPASADFLLLSRTVPTGLKPQQVIFATDYDLLYHDENVIGAFYWQKGRPNLVFIRNRLERHSLSLAHEFDKYIEENL